LAQQGGKINRKCTKEKERAKEKEREKDYI